MDIICRGELGILIQIVMKKYSIDKKCCANIFQSYYDVNIAFFHVIRGGGNSLMSVASNAAAGRCGLFL